VRPDSYVEINNFYTPTVYEKGAEVVRMMQTLVGRAGFARGITLYFARHDGQAVTCDDFAQAIADANPESELAKRLTPFKRWYAQPGTPRLTARGRYDAPSRTYTLGLEQAPAATAGPGAREPFVIPLEIGLLARDGRAMTLRLEDEPPAAAATSRLLVLDETRAFFTFVDVEQAPVLSLLRGFSAPVQLVDGLGDADLMVLLRHDADPFNRWEAGQRLAMSRLLAATTGDAQAALDPDFVESMRELLRNPDLDPAFKELVLTLPSEAYIAEQLAVVDPQRIHAARESMKQQLATALVADWQWAFETHQVVGEYSPDPASAGRRALANLALAMLCIAARQSGDAVWPGRAWQGFKDASNMTDRQGALMAIVASGSVLADAAFERMHAMFNGDALVLDKWFSMQAAAQEQPDGRVFERVKRLLRHPDFSIANPNRARSVIGAFCLGNPGGFHRSDGAGYAFWADRVLEIDALNPQLASRIARALDRWTQLAEPYRSAAQSALARVAAHPKLSTDTEEIVSRALAGA
jgi:aminopeptidase N